MPFSPSDISGLKIWLKADAGAGSSNNDPVATWVDQSGTSHDFTQATSGKRPTYKTNIRNGLPVVSFDASDDELVGGDLSAVFPSAATVVCALNDKNNLHLGKLMAYQTKSNDLHWHFTSGEGYEGVFRSSRLNNTPSSGLPASGWHCWSFTADGTAYKMWVDGTNKINAGSFTFDGGDNHGIGHQSVNAYYSFMEMAELIVYDSVLSDVDRQSVETYLFSKWSIGPQIITGIVLTTVPTFPQAKINYRLTGVAKTTTPTLPAGALSQPGFVNGVVLTTIPSLPPGSLRKVVNGVVLTVTPSLPSGAVRRIIAGAALTVSPSLPSAMLLVGDQFVNGVVLTVIPRLPAGALHYGGSPGGANDTWVLYLGPSDG